VAYILLVCIALILRVQEVTASISAHVQSVLSEVFRRMSQFLEANSVYLKLR
jgi:hypothetical protein